MQRQSVRPSYHAQVQQDSHQHHEHGQPGSHTHDEHDHQAHTHSGILNALGDCQVVIANGMGQRLWDDLQGNNYEVFITRETDISKAVRLFLEGSLDSEGKRCCTH